MPDKFGPSTPSQKAARLNAIFAEAESIVQSTGAEWLVPFLLSRFLPHTGVVAMLVSAQDVLDTVVKTITDPTKADETVSQRQLVIEDVLIAHGPDNDPIIGELGDIEDASSNGDGSPTEGVS